VLDLAFSPEQDMLRDTVRKLCATFCPLPIVRKLEDDAVGYPRDLWSQLADLDLTS
jgi:alkylation response protein AidB-like acyl-CoA dehydrogenase